MSAIQTRYCDQITSEVVETLAEKIHQTDERGQVHCWLTSILSPRQLVARVYLGELALDCFLRRLLGSPLGDGSLRDSFAVWCQPDFSQPDSVVLRFELN